MKMLIRLLVTTTAILTATTVGVGVALMRERARIPVTPPGTIPPSVRIPAPSDDSYGAGRTPANAMRGEGETAQCPDPARIAAARARLQQLSEAGPQDATGRRRASLLASWNEIAPLIQMPPALVEPLIDALLEHSFRADQQRLECQASPQCPPCEARTVDSALAQRRRQVIAEQLGPEVDARYEAYVFAIPERTYVNSLREGLGTRHRMDAMSAERLVLDLADERRRFIDEADRQGRRVRISGFAVQDFEGDDPPRPFSSLNDAMTTAFNERVRSTAARHLTRAQLEAFTVMQDERLANARLLNELSR